MLKKTNTELNKINREIYLKNDEDMVLFYTI